MLTTGSLVVLTSASLSGCSVFDKSRAYLLGKPVNENARRADAGRTTRENLERNSITPASDIGPGYFRLENKGSGYSPSITRDESSAPYKPGQGYKGLFWFGKEF